jgi:uncharacterized membrane protein
MWKTPSEEAWKPVDLHFLTRTFCAVCCSVLLALVLQFVALCAAISKTSTVQVIILVQGVLVQLQLFFSKSLMN